MGAHRRPALASPEEPEGIDPLQEPNEYLATRPWKTPLVTDGIPAAFEMNDPDAEYRRVAALGVSLARAPIDAGAGAARMAILDDDRGNPIQIIPVKDGRARPPDPRVR